MLNILFQRVMRVVSNMASKTLINNRVQVSNSGIPYVLSKLLTIFLLLEILLHLSLRHKEGKLLTYLRAETSIRLQHDD